jgi:hypothetical protein
MLTLVDGDTLGLFCQGEQPPHIGDMIVTV